MKDHGFKLLNEYVKEVINPLLPCAMPEGFSSIEGFQLENEFKDSIFEFNGFKNGKCNLIHFTSIDNFLNIIRSGCFWMFELNRMDDSKETLLFQEKLGAPDEELIKEFKSSHFVLSTCEKSESVINNDCMWCKYGDKGRGVAIELEINDSLFNDPTLLLFAGRIQYIGKTSPKYIDEIKHRHEEFEKKNGMKLNEVLNKILEIVSSFCKNEKDYAFEKEVRILRKTNKPPGDFHFYTDTEYTYDSSSNKIYNFTRLPIDNNGITIRKIYLKDSTCYERINFQFFDNIKWKFKEKYKTELEIEII